MTRKHALRSKHRQYANKNNGTGDRVKILVLNGSPKGKYSITLQTSLYLEKYFPGHEFNILHVGQYIRAYEKDFSTAADALKEADLVIFSYPVYTFIAPSQLHRFIRLLKMSGIDMSGKFATQITTSKHFYDVTAHRYIQDNCQDLGMKFIKGLSADMNDLLAEEGRKTAKEFFEYVCWCIQNDIYEPLPKKAASAAHLPVSPAAVSEDGNARNGDGKAGDVVIVTDCTEDDRQLSDMISRFSAVLRIRAVLSTYQSILSAADAWAVSTVQPPGSACTGMVLTTSCAMRSRPRML